MVQIIPWYNIGTFWYGFCKCYKKEWGKTFHPLTFFLFWTLSKKSAPEKCERERGRAITLQRNERRGTCVHINTHACTFKTRLIYRFSHMIKNKNISVQ